MKTLEQEAVEYATYKFEDTETLDTLRKQDFKAGAKFIIKQIENFINTHTYNAHDMSNDNPYKQYYLGKDDAYCEILHLVKEINDGQE